MAHKLSCEISVKNFLKPKDDMQSEPYPMTDFNLFMDGSCHKGKASNLAGYAVVRHNAETDDF